MQNTSLNAQTNLKGAPENPPTKILTILRELQKLDNDFPLQYAICLLEISQNEGITITALSKKSGIALSTISRIVGALSTSRQKGKAYGLVDVRIHPKERRKKELYLTTAGHDLIERLTKITA